MKIKLTFILLLLSAFNVFGDDNKKLSNDEIKKLPPSKSINLEEKDVLTVCKGDDVTKWNNCWGKIVVDHPCDPEKWCGTWSKGLYYNGKKHGFFHEGIWNGRTTHRSDGIDYAGYYNNGIKVGLHGRCYYAQAGRTDFQIGNYNQEGKPEGIWASYDGWYDDFPQNEDGWHETFRDSGCHVETALLYLNKEEPCGYNKKSFKGYPNMFTRLSTGIYLHGEEQYPRYGEACRGIHALEVEINYKNTKEYKQWLKMLEMHEK